MEGLAKKSTKFNKVIIKEGNYQLEEISLLGKQKIAMKIEKKEWLQKYLHNIKNHLNMTADKQQLKIWKSITKGLKW